MAGDQNTAELSRGMAAVRAAEALLRTLGGCTVWVRVPAAIASADDGSQLGLEGQATEDIALSPAVARHPFLRQLERDKLEITISAASLALAKDIHCSQDADVFFRSALGLVYAGKLLRIENILADEFGGIPYLYRLIVSG